MILFKYHGLNITLTVTIFPSMHKCKLATNPPFMIVQTVYLHCTECFCHLSSCKKAVHIIQLPVFQGFSITLH